MSEQGGDFKDHFSGHAADYAAHRPHYPSALFEWLAENSPGHRLAWDCACGNGQAAVALAGHFEHVVASDASARQIEFALPHPKVSYRIEKAEHSACEAGSVDLLTVAQAWHWFDHGAFKREAGRVLGPGGLLAVWAYPLATVDEAVDALVFDLYDRQLGPYWSPERAYIERAYSDLKMPWPELDAPPFEMTARWNLAALLGYIGTWSALRRCMARERRDPLEAMRGALATAWGDPSQEKSIYWPLIVKVSRKPS